MKDRLRPSRLAFRLSRLLLAAGIFACFSPCPAAARIWRVAQDGTGDFSSVQQAILASVNGDEVVVDPGTYLERLWFGGRGITVRSALGPSVTILDAGHTGSVVTMDRLEGPQTVIDGFTLQGGTGTRLSLAFGDESAQENPGGPWTEDAARTRSGRSGEETSLEKDSGARQFRYGGGILLLGSGPTLRNLAVLGNTADYGGGLYGNVSSPRMTNCRFGRNVAGTGAGTMLEGSSSADLEGCAWAGNRAALGGGIALLFSAIGARDCRFSMNEAGEGGALWIRGGDEPSRLDHCILWKNLAGEASALRVFDAAADLEWCTLAGNGFPEIELAAVYYRDGSRGEISHTVFLENTSAHAVLCSNGDLNLSCDDFWPRPDPDPGCASGGNNFSLDPRMCNPRRGDFHLRPGSPCLPDSLGTGCGPVGALGLGCSAREEENW